MTKEAAATGHAARPQEPHRRWLPLAPLAGGVLLLAAPIAGLWVGLVLLGKAASAALEHLGRAVGSPAGVPGEAHLGGRGGQGGPVEDPSLDPLEETVEARRHPAAPPDGPGANEKGAGDAAPAPGSPPTTS